MKIEIDYSPPCYYFGHAALTERSYKLLHGCCSGQRIVDLGCGSGELLRHLAEAYRWSDFRSVVGNRELWEFFTRRNLEHVIRQQLGCQFVAAYSQSGGLPGKRGLPLVARYQEERCGITDVLEDWAV